MQPATSESVLGDFENTAFLHDGVETLFTKIDGRHVVRTNTLEGPAADFAVGYTFGIDPLQQYLVELDNGRYQALDIA